MALSMRLTGLLGSLGVRLLARYDEPVLCSLGERKVTVRRKVPLELRMFKEWVVAGRIIASRKLRRLCH